MGGIEGLAVRGVRELQRVALRRAQNMDVVVAVVHGFRRRETAAQSVDAGAPRRHERRAGNRVRDGAGDGFHQVPRR